jgi:ribosomal protein L35
MHRHNFSRHLRARKSEARKRAQKKQVVMTGYFARKLRKYLGIRTKHYGTR